MKPTPDPGLEHVLVSGSLNPRAIGQRVVVRSVVPGETGPTGGPAFTDVLGVLEAWADGTLSIRTEAGALVMIPTERVVSGKPVPPRPSRFSRMTVEDVERRCTAFSRCAESEAIGDWEARVTQGTDATASAAFLSGDPGQPVEDALAAIADFYARHSRPAVARVVTGSSIDSELVARGWQPLGAESSENEVQLAGVAAVARELQDVAIESVVYEPQLSYDWLVGDQRAQENFPAVAAAVDLPQASFGSLHREGRQVARARITLVDGWAQLTDLFVQPEHRHQGLARTIIAGMVERAAERGASVLAAQTRDDNEAAQALCRALGFERHHGFRYLVAPA